MVATSTPEMKRIREVIESRQQKLSKKAKKRFLLEKQGDAQSSSEDDNEEGIILMDTDDDTPEHSEDEDPSQVQLGSVDYDNIKTGSFVLVEFKPETRSARPVFYVGKVLNVPDSARVDIEFYRKSQKVLNKFVRPNVEDIHPIDLSDIKAVLPAPVSHGTTSRTKGGIVFPVNLGNLDIR